MNFRQKISNTILVTFQMRVIFKQPFMFSHTYTCLNEKPHPNFFVKSHEWNSSHGIEIIHLIHIQYMSKYFIKFGNCFNRFCIIFAPCSILLRILYIHKYII